MLLKLIHACLVHVHVPTCTAVLCTYVPSPPDPLALPANNFSHVKLRSWRRERESGREREKGGGGGGGGV